MIRRPPRSTRTDTLFPYTTLFRSEDRAALVRQLLYRSFQRLQAAPCLPLLFQAGKLGGHVDAAEIGGLLDLVQTVPTPVVVEHVARNGEQRSEERRVGKECVSTCSSRWSPYH